MNTKAAQEHLVKLASQHNIIIHWRQRAWTNFEAHTSTRMVFIGAPTSPIRYLGALHEIGHIVSPVAREARRGHQLTEEAAAWDWALDNANPTLLPDEMVELRKSIGRAWASYLSIG